MLKWREEYLNKIKSMGNEEILDEVILLSGGDDYDGCFTQRGSWMYRECSAELYSRLYKCGFLKL